MAGIKVSTFNQIREEFDCENKKTYNFVNIGNMKYLKFIKRYWNRTKIGKNIKTQLFLVVSIIKIY